MSESEWERLRDLFEGALDRAPDQRAAYLRERVADPGMQHEIESLLAAHAAAASFLPESAIGRPRDSDDRDGGSPAPNARLALAPGTQLGAFEILDLIGAGGMGEVYRARDRRLDRFVAIKVLAAEPDTAPRGRERFEREARAISRLSHPHICTVHDVGVAEIGGRDLPFLVMELLDGETLADRLARGPLPLADALASAIDIADALVAAHGQGVVHRDLKPANVILTNQGVKLLDFGLAQLRSTDAVGGAAAAPPAGSMTSAGLVFGTVPYMSPEQLRGQPTDERTDVFSFGVMLHELLTGDRPFAADSQAGLIAAILEHEARPVSAVQPLATAHLDRVVRKCLAKHPDDRWQTARDLKSELIWARDGGDATPQARSRSTAPASWRRRVVTAIPVAAAAILGLLLWTLGRPAAVPRSVTRLSLNLPPGVTLDIPINSSSFAIAPAGDRIAFVGVRDGLKALYIHVLASGTTQEVPDTGDAGNPMFSPDGRWVAFAQGRVAKKVPATGGAIQLAANGPANQMTWLANGELVRGGPIPIRRVGDDGRPLTQLAEGEEGHNTPLWLPGGSLLFTILRGGYQSAASSIAVWPAGASKARELLRNATTPRLVGDDAIVFAQGRSLMAAAFDSLTQRLVGEPRALNLQVQTTLYSAAPMYALAGNGTLVYAARTPGRRLVWFDRQGHEEPVKADERMYSHLRLSPDGTKVAVYVADGDRDLWVFAVDGSHVQKLTAGPARDAMPVWSPDGSQIFFTTGERTICRIPADRSTGPVTLLKLPYPERIHPLSISPDGTRLLTHWDVLPARVDLRVLELGPRPTLSPLVSDSATDQDGRLSPDGRWLAYQSAQSIEGQDGQVMVRPFPDVRAGQWVISPGAGRHPIWSRDGRELFYRTVDGVVMAVPVSATSRFAHGPPVPIVRPTNTLRDFSGPTYDVSPDGRRFLLIKAPELEIRSLDIVLNWDVEVNALLDRDGR